MDRAVKVVAIIAIAFLTLGAVTISLGVIALRTSAGAGADIGAGIALLFGLFVGAGGLVLAAVAGVLRLRRRHR